MILDEPRRFSMGTFVTNDDTHIQHPPCGTVACIAGWAVIEHDRARGKSGSIRVTQKYADGVLSFGAKAAEVLGLDEQQAGRLFYTGNWPERFYDEYYEFAPGSLGRAKVAAERLDHFIATGGEE